MTNIRVCKGSNSGEKFSLGERGGLFWLSVLDACSSYKPRGEKITYLAGGSYGAVFDIYVADRERHKRHNVALKVISIGKLKDAKARQLKGETLSEMHFGQLMSDANIGPKIYDQFIFQKNISFGGNKKKGIQGEFEWGLILMEKFQGSGADFLWTGGSGRKWGVAPNTKNRAIVIRKMMDLARRMISQGLYCWDIKPGNYVANVNGNTSRNIQVRMIDFGGQFCVFGKEARDSIISKMQASAQKASVLPSAFRYKQDISSLTTISVEEFNEIFYYLIMIPFLVLLNDRYTGFDFQEVARPILHRICEDNRLRLAMALLLKNSSIIFKTFQHYTKKMGETAKSPGQTVAYFASVLQDLCLQNTPARRKGRTKKLKTPDRLKAARRTRRRLRLQRRGRRRGGRRINPHSLITPGLQGSQMSVLAKSLQKPDRIHTRLVQLYDALT